MRIRLSARPILINELTPDLDEFPHFHLWTTFAIHRFVGTRFPLKNEGGKPGASAWITWGCGPVSRTGWRH